MSSIFLKLLNMSMTAMYLVLAILILRLLLKKAPKWITCSLWGLVGLRLLCPFSFESIFSLIPTEEFLPGETVNSFSTFTPTISEIFEYATKNPVSYDLAINNNASIVFSEISAPDNVEYLNPLLIITTILSIIWVVGIIGMLIYTIISYLRIHKRIGEAVILEDNIYICDRIDTPFILGIFRPQIYIPSGMNEGDRKYVIAHEKAHIKRFDHLWKPFGFLLLSVYWFNPVLWLAYILLCRDIEFACDEKVLKSMGKEIKKPYSTALINCSAERKLISACPVAFGETSVKARIKSVLNYKKPAFWIIVIAVIASIITGVCFMTNPVSKSAQNSNENKFSQDKIEMICTKPELQIYSVADFDTYRFKEGQHYYKAFITIKNNYNRTLRFITNDLPEDTEHNNIKCSFDTQPYPIDIKPGESYKNAGYLEFTYAEKTSDEEAYRLITDNSWEISLTAWDKEKEFNSLLGKFSWKIQLPHNEKTDIESENTAPTGRDDGLSELIHLYYDDRLYVQSVIDAVDYNELITKTTIQFVGEVKKNDNSRLPTENFASYMAKEGYKIYKEASEANLYLRADNDRMYLLVNESPLETVTPTSTAKKSNYILDEVDGDVYGFRTKTDYELTENNSILIENNAVFVTSDVVSNNKTDGYEYSLHENGYAEITGCTLNQKNIEIPSVLDGHPVGYIGENAFIYAKPESVSVPEGVMAISSNAFGTTLRSVKLPDSLIALGMSAFQGCGWLETVRFGSKLQIIGEDCFNSCNSLKEVTIPSNVKVLCRSAFGNCSNLSSIKLNKGLIRIGTDCFSCTNITEITVPEGIYEIDAGAFSDCKSLKKVTLPKTVGDTDNGFGWAMFRNCSSLEEVNLPENISRIWSETFEGCTNLKSLTVPASVNEIEANNFRGCRSLKDIYFESADCIINPINEFALRIGLTVHAPKDGSVEKFFIAYPLIRFVDL